MQKFLVVKRLISIISSFILLGCAARVQTNVTSFHELNQPLTGKTFAFLPSKEQEGSLEYRSYAKAVQVELEKRGMKMASFDNANYAVFMTYGIDNGKEIISSYPIVGQTGTIGSYTTGTVTGYGNTATVNATTYKAPTYGVVGTGTTSDTVYKRYFNIDIIDMSKSKGNTIEKVYEGKATSSGSSGQLSVVMPAIMKSVFDDFPGKSGATREVVNSMK